MVKMKNLEIGHEILFVQSLSEIHPNPSLLKGAVKKLPRDPLTLPSPARGEGKYIETPEEIPSPSMGEG